MDSDLEALHAVRQRIENIRILFPVRSSAITSDQSPLLAALVRDIDTVEILSRLLDRPLGLRIVGHTDDSGSEMANLKLSRDRAEAVRRFLIDNGNVNIALMAVGMGSKPRVDRVPDEQDQSKSRCAGFELVNDVGFRQGKD